MSSTTLSSDFAQQTADEGATNQSPPPLLPAFLITGLLLIAIIVIIVWRHIIERRHMLHRGEGDQTWPSTASGAVGSGFAQAPKPKLWEPRFISSCKDATWKDILPLSVVALRGKAKPDLPPYLLPPERRPMSFLTRMFGGRRNYLRSPRPRRSPHRPPVPLSILIPPHTPMVENDDGPIDRLEITVLIALPQPPSDRQASYLGGKDSSDGLVEFPEVEDIDLLALSGSGKKRRSEMVASGRKGDFDDEDEEGVLEVFFGTATLPFAEGVEF